jgi:uncharacterized membrane protein
MSAPAIGAIIGLVLAAIWAIAGFWWVLLASVLAGVGALVGMVVSGDVDLTQFLGHQHGGPETVRKSKEK